MLNEVTWSDSLGDIVLKLCFVVSVLGSPGDCCHHVPDQHFSPGRGGAMESGNLSPEAQDCPAKTHYILLNVTQFIIVIS